MKEFKRPRPEFPKRAVITAGMPYGNKSLHFGHIGGVFIHADTFSRFLKDRIGKENVIFVSGTDCYGSPIVASYKKHIDETGENITMHDYVYRFHMIQKNILNDYDVSPSLYTSSAFGRSGEIHNEVSKKLFDTMYEGGYLKKMSSLQFFDPVENEYLNGRQVLGECPFEGCKSDKAYADECALGHQYMPSELINPVSILSGVKPELKNVSNWYFILDEYTEQLKKMVDRQRKEKKVRPMVLNITDEFLKDPAIYVTRKEQEKLVEAGIELKNCTLIDEPKKPSVTYEFDSLSDRDDARAILEASSIRFRTGKTLVPFRLSGNIDWGVPVPNKEDLNDLTFWVWPESLWAPVSFTKAYLESIGKDPADWKDWWIADETKVYQFIGEDNIYFYGIAEMGMLLAYLGIGPDEKRDLNEVNFPELIANCHLLFLDTKASSSGEIKPPMADELLEYYTKDQLRMHFLSLGLSKKSVSFNPKPFDPNSNPAEADVVLKDGNLLTNVFNRLVRSCFYTAQKYTDSVIPTHEVSEEILNIVEKGVLEYEANMARQEFHRVIYTLDSLIRSLSKYWAREMKIADDNDDNLHRERILADSFYGVKTTLTLLHPIVPESAEHAREYLNLNETVWSWDHILKPTSVHMDDSENHRLKFIEPKFDFFKKHECQFGDSQA
ncbi:MULTISPECIES: class I tRNA ligase family protein [unclassified Fusibacter]|uniref:class I tRNA ligase family protein n=1 Tax=unclassified Fusibacter TaxID=2624464 RepID=UPI001011FBC4|nr:MULTISPECIES: class I tRNA ligase family protein [unclassified Fusibacter]MCK8060766.1 class I tRNA ligase family protein [Fusibacter sp. A2]NPE23062.1 class I tRNA ligase family protein [Fusibacter sp. A1]RXV59734.1 methionine--tRNA ligase [Fusibacter sp. A1]